MLQGLQKCNGDNEKLPPQGTNSMYLKLCKIAEEEKQAWAELDQAQPQL